MTTTAIAALGAIAGFTIFLGLPLGRLRTPAAAERGMTCARSSVPAAKGRSAPRRRG